MNLIHEEMQDDGSGWVAVVEVAGVKFRASYVNNKLLVGLVPYKHNPRRPRWAEKSVMQWASKRVAGFDAEWMSKHRSIYQ